MFSTMYSTFLTMFPILEEDLPIPKRRKKRVCFSKKNQQITIPSIKIEEYPHLWWNKKDAIKANKIFQLEMISFMETYNDVMLNKHLKPVTRCVAKKLFLQY